MAIELEAALGILKEHEAELRRLGVQHASVFGSVARGQSRPDSDVDVLVDLDPGRPIDVFAYARLKLYIDDLFAGASDVANRKTLKPLLRENILSGSVSAF